MAFKRADFNATEQVAEKGLITGRRNTAFLRNRYQTELDNANAAVVDMVHYCEEQSSELKKAFNKAEGIKANIAIHKKERGNAYEALNNLLKKEIDFEGFMNKETLSMYKEVSKNQSAKGINVKQRMINSDNEIYTAGMMKYLDKHPDIGAKSSIHKIQDRIIEEDKRVSEYETDAKKAVSAYHDLLQEFKIWIQKAKDKIKEYHRILEEGQKKIDETRYKKGVIYKVFTSERRKQEVNLDTIKHRMPQFENTLKIIEEELSAYEGRKFKEVEY